MENTSLFAAWLVQIEKKNSMIQLYAQIFNNHLNQLIF